MSSKKLNKENYPNLHKEVYLLKTNVLESIDASKNEVIKNIMRIVDNNVSDQTSHKFIRGAVLDEINDMAREFADILERAYK